MTRPLPALLAFGVLLLAACGGDGGEEPSTAQPSATTQESTAAEESTAPKPAEPAGFASVKACELFTLDDAKQIIGPGAEPGGGTSIDQKSAMLELTSCTYSNEDGSHIANVLVRAPLTQAGADQNKGACEVDRTDAMRESPEFGEGALFDPELGQVCTVINGVHVVMGGLKSGSGNAFGSYSIGDVRKLADIVRPRIEAG